MLILTRRIGEKIRIGDDVTVAVFRVHGTNVRIGVEAPKSVPVHRAEIYEQVVGAECAIPAATGHP